MSSLAYTRPGGEEIRSRTYVRPIDSRNVEKNRPNGAWFQLSRRPSVRDGDPKSRTLRFSCTWTSICEVFTKWRPNRARASARSNERKDELEARTRTQLWTFSHVSQFFLGLSFFVRFPFSNIIQPNTRETPAVTSVSGNRLGEATGPGRGDEVKGTGRCRDDDDYAHSLMLRQKIKAIVFSVLSGLYYMI